MSESTESVRKAIKRGIEMKRKEIAVISKQIFVLEQQMEECKKDLVELEKFLEDENG